MFKLKLYENCFEVMCVKSSRKKTGNKLTCSNKIVNKIFEIYLFYGIMICF